MLAIQYIDLHVDNVTSVAPFYLHISEYTRSFLGWSTSPILDSD